MPEPYRLSEHDRQVLQRLIDREKRGFRNPPYQRPRREVDVHQAPEVYVAKTPAGGIPALEEDTLGTADSPGFALCNCFRITRSDPPVLVRVSALREKVWNLSKSIIPADEWVIIWRDKGGDWWTLGPAGAGGESIWAKITARDEFAYSWVEAEKIPPTAGSFATTRGKAFQVKEAGLSGTLNLYERNYFANVPIGSWVQIYPGEDTTTGTGTGTGTGDDTWIFEYEKNNFPARILSGAGPTYTVEEHYPPGSPIVDNPRVVDAEEINGVTGINPNTEVFAFVFYDENDELTYYFEYDPGLTGCGDCDSITIEERDIQCGGETGSGSGSSTIEVLKRTITISQGGGAGTGTGDDCCLEKTTGAWGVEKTLNCGFDPFDHTCPNGVSFDQYRTECLSGVITVFVRTITLNIVNGCLSLTEGEWNVDHTGGCCDCPGTGTGTGTGNPEEGCCQERPFGMPAVLYMHVTNVSGCACMAGDFEIDQQPDGTYDIGQAEPVCSGNGLTALLECVGSTCDDFRLTAACGTPPFVTQFATEVPPDAGCSCLPISLTFSGLSVTGVCCTGTVDIVIDENP